MLQKKGEMLRKSGKCTGKWENRHENGSSGIFFLKKKFSSEFQKKFTFGKRALDNNYCLIICDKLVIYIYSWLREKLLGLVQISNWTKKFFFQNFELSNYYLSTFFHFFCSKIVLLVFYGKIYIYKIFFKTSVRDIFKYFVWSIIFFSFKIFFLVIIFSS